MGTAQWPVAIPSVRVSVFRQLVGWLVGKRKINDRRNPLGSGLGVSSLCSSSAGCCHRHVAIPSVRVSVFRRVVRLLWGFPTLRLVASPSVRVSVFRLACSYPKRISKPWWHRRRNPLGSGLGVSSEVTGAIGAGSVFFLGRNPLGSGLGVSSKGVSTRPSVCT